MICPSGAEKIDFKFGPRVNMRADTKCTPISLFLLSALHDGDSLDDSDRRPGWLDDTLLKVGPVPRSVQSTYVLGEQLLPPPVHSVTLVAVCIVSTVIY